MRRAWIGGIALFLGGCVGHILPYTPKVRSYVVENYADPPSPTALGSIYQEGPGWLSDVRSHTVGDIITVRIDEGESGVHRASTNLSRGSKIEAGIPSLFTLGGALTKLGMDPARLVSAQTGNQHRGEGETSRTGRLNATLPVRIKKVLPNGDFYVEGSKVVLLNSEEHHLYLSGVARKLDLLADNSIQSSRLADLQVELTGRGVVSEKQRPGWASRIMDYVWPF